MNFDMRYTIVRNQLKALRKAKAVKSAGVLAKPPEKAIRSGGSGIGPSLILNRADWRSDGGWPAVTGDLPETFRPGPEYPSG